MGSAYGQNAVDTALTHLHNHFIRIRNDLYSHFVKDKSIYLVQSLRSLANKMRQYQKELKNPLISKKQKEYLREKIYNIFRMLQGKKKLNKLRRAYNHKRDYEIAQAIKEVVDKYKGKK